VRPSVGPVGDDLLAVLAVVAGVQERLVVGDLDGGTLDVDDVCGRGREQVAVGVADGERVLEQPARGVRDLGLSGDGVGDQLAGAPEQVLLISTSG